MARALEDYRVEMLAKLQPERPPTPPGPAEFLSNARQFGTTQATLCSAARLAAAQLDHEREHPWRTQWAAASAAQGRYPSEADDFIRLGDTDSSSCDLSHSGELDRGSSCASVPAAAGMLASGASAISSGQLGGGFGNRATGFCSGGGGRSSGRLQLQPLPYASRRSSCSNTSIGAAAAAAGPPAATTRLAAGGSRRGSASWAMSTDARAAPGDGVPPAVAGEATGYDCSSRRCMATGAQAQQPPAASGPRSVSFVDRLSAGQIRQQRDFGMEGVLSIGVMPASSDDDSGDDDGCCAACPAVAAGHEARGSGSGSGSGADRTSNCSSSSGAVPALVLPLPGLGLGRPSAAPSSQRRQLLLQSQQRGGGEFPAPPPPPPPPFAWEYSRGGGASAALTADSTAGGAASGMGYSEGANAGPAATPLPRRCRRRATLDGEGVWLQSAAAAHEGAAADAGIAETAGGDCSEYVGDWHASRPRRPQPHGGADTAAAATAPGALRGSGALRPTFHVGGPSGATGGAAAPTAASGPWPSRPPTTHSRLHGRSTRRISLSNDTVNAGVYGASAATCGGGVGSSSTTSGEVAGTASSGAVGGAATCLPPSAQPAFRRFASHSSSSHHTAGAAAALHATVAAGGGRRRCSSDELAGDVCDLARSEVPVANAAAKTSSNAAGTPPDASEPWARAALMRPQGRGGMSLPPAATSATATVAAGAINGALSAARLDAAAESTSAPLPSLRPHQQQQQQQHPLPQQQQQQQPPQRHRPSPALREREAALLLPPQCAHQYVQTMAGASAGTTTDAAYKAWAATATGGAPPAAAGSRRYSRRSLDEALLARAASGHSSGSTCSSGRGSGSAQATGGGHAQGVATGGSALPLGAPAESAAAAAAAAAAPAPQPARELLSARAVLAQGHGNSSNVLKPSAVPLGTFTAASSAAAASTEITASEVEAKGAPSGADAAGAGGGTGGGAGAAGTGGGGRMMAKLFKALSDLRSGD